MFMLCVYILKQEVRRYDDDVA